MTSTMKKLFGVAGILLATQAVAQVTFYEGEGFRGRAFSANREIRNFERFGFNDRAASAVVERGRWQVCEDARFEGRCVILRPGNYATLADLGMTNRISSVRPVVRNVVAEEVPPPPVAPVYEYRVRPTERIFQAPVVAVHAVVGPPERRCWVERQEVSGGDANVGGAIIGGILGGVLGHQIGNGRGNDAATAGGAIAGAAIGANRGRDGGYTQDVQRCRDVPAAGGRPEYWDVTYEFRGTQHRVQMQAPPGATVMVNANGEPRG